MMIVSCNRTTLTSYCHSSFCNIECTQHIAQRHHSAIFFGLFFGVCDCIFTAFVQGSDRPSITVANSGPYSMSKGSALSAMLWCGIVVYTIDRRWVRAMVFCILAALFAGIGIIHQEGSVFDELWTEGTITKETSALEYMIGYLSMAALCFIYFVLQKVAGKKVKEGEEGYDNDHGYDQPIEEPGVDDMFATWWEPAENALALAMGKDGTKKVPEDAEAPEVEQAAEVEAA